MKEEPYKKILDREIPSQQVQEHFKDALELLQEVTNYGTNLIPRCFVSSKRTLTDIIILGVFLKHAVAMVDSIEINISHGAVLASYVPARSLFETYLYISWILNSDTDLRAKQYYVWNLRQRRLWANRTIPGTPENQALQAMFKDHAFSIELSKKENVVEDARKQLQSIYKILNQPDFKPINDQLDELKKSNFDKPWYVLSGARSLRVMATKLSRLPEYTIFYSNFSEVVHSGAFQKHISVKKGTIIFEPIRHLDTIQMVLHTVISLAIKIYREILTKYREGEIENFSRKYLMEWRERFLSIKRVKYKISLGDPI